MEVVFVTGFPGPRARLLAEAVLAEEPDTQVWLLADPSALADAAAVVDSWPERRRVRILEGDQAGLDFGLSGAEYLELVEAVTLIHHVAGLHAHRKGPRAEVSRRIRGATQEAIELTRATGARLVHHSTAFVSGDRSGVVYEDQLDQGQSFFTPAQEAMAEAEAQVRREMRANEVVVLRPTLLLGDRGMALEAGPSLLVMLAQGFPGLSLPRPTARLDLVPIGYAMRAAHVIARAPAAPGKTFHVTSGAPQTTERVFELIACEVGEREAPSLSAGAAEVLLRTPGLDRVLGEARTFLQQLGTGATYDARNADRILGPADLRCPDLEAHLPDWVRRVQDHLSSSGP